LHKSDTSNNEDYLGVNKTYATNGNNTFLDQNYSNKNRLGDAFEEKDNKNYWALLALVLAIGTTCGNILICLAIFLEKQLQNVTNYFLASLAITDLMVATLVMPLGIVTLFKGECSLLRLETFIIFTITLNSD
jgi:hypothetical protein